MAPAPTPSPTTPEPTPYQAGRRLDATDSDSDNAAAGATPPSPWVKTWHHYCVTYAAEEHPKEKDRYLPGNVTLYVDGRKEGTWKNATVNTSLGSPLYIGADIHGSETLDGAVDEVYVYDKALDLWQVEVLHGLSLIHI